MCIVAISLVDLCLQHRPHVPRFNADHRQARFRESYRISERCAEFTDEILNFWVDVLRNPLVEVKRDGKKVMVRKYTVEQQFMASDRLMDRAFGKAPAVAQVDQNLREMAVRKIEVRWLPPDPNDASKHILPEPD